MNLLCSLGRHKPEISAARLYSSCAYRSFFSVCKRCGQDLGDGDARIIFLNTILNDAYQAGLETSKQEISHDR